MNLQGPGALNVDDGGATNTQYTRHEITRTVREALLYTRNHVVFHAQSGEPTRDSFPVQEAQLKQRERERERDKNKTERSEEPGGLGYNVLAPAKWSSCAITTAMRRYRFILLSMRVSCLHPVYDLRKTKTEEEAKRDKIETEGNRRIRADVKGLGKRN